MTTKKIMLSLLSMLVLAICFAQERLAPFYVEICQKSADKPFRVQVEKNLVILHHRLNTAQRTKLETAIDISRLTPAVGDMLYCVLTEKPQANDHLKLTDELGTEILALFFGILSLHAMENSTTEQEFEGKTNEIRLIYQQIQDLDRKLFGKAYEKTSDVWLLIALPFLCEEVNIEAWETHKNKASWQKSLPFFQKGTQTLLAEFDSRGAKALDIALPQWFKTKTIVHPAFVFTALPDFYEILEKESANSPNFSGVQAYLKRLSTLPEGTEYLACLVNGQETARMGYWYFTALLAVELMEHGYDVRTQLPPEMQAKLLVVDAMYSKTTAELFRKNLAKIREKVIIKLESGQNMEESANITRYEKIIEYLVVALKASQKDHLEPLIANVYQVIDRWVLLCPDKCYESKREAILNNVISILQKER